MPDGHDKTAKQQRWRPPFVKDSIYLEEEEEEDDYQDDDFAVLFADETF